MGIIPLAAGVVTTLHTRAKNSVRELTDNTAYDVKTAYLLEIKKGKGKAVPLQAWSGPEGSTKLRFPDFMTTAQKGGKVVSPTHRPH